MDSWHDMSDWSADPAIPGSTATDVNTRWPLEIQCHDDISNVPGVAHTVRLREQKRRGWINSEDKSYRLYVNWCGKGNLADLIAAFGQAHHLIPEPMIWHVAEAIAKSGVTMQHGVVPPMHGGPLPPAAPGWREIVHRVSMSCKLMDASMLTSRQDMKPANVFLDRPLHTHWQCYPNVFLGDFGLATETDANDNRNPDFWQGVGTNGFFS